MTDYTQFKWQEYPEHDDPVLFDARGYRRTASLFMEVTRDTQCPPIFTMKDYSKNGCMSAYELYMDSVDEADAAMKMVGSLSHWRKLLTIPWFIDGKPSLSFAGVTQWRLDMAARDASQAKRQLLSRMRDGDVGAAKKIYDSAVAGKLAGQKAVAKPDKAKPAARRGVQQDAADIDLAAAFNKLED